MSTWKIKWLDFLQRQGTGLIRELCFVLEALFCFRDQDIGKAVEERFPFLPFSSSPQPGPRGRILSLTLFFFPLQPPITPRWMVHNSTQVNTRTRTRSCNAFTYQIKVVRRVGGGVASSFKRIVQVVSRTAHWKSGVSDLRLRHELSLTARCYQLICDGKDVFVYFTGLQRCNKGVYGETHLTALQILLDELQIVGFKPRNEHNRMLFV